ncbi:MAG: ATP-dependent helicase [Gemmatimonadetes bacterium]|nr:ATP-dependent helicase [Gemmatimonadota bacterium]MYG15882.1 ATP-dependent helicase [Gemmatimonadota bacterium]
MPLSESQARDLLLTDLNHEQQNAVSSNSRRLLVVAGAGSGKTEIMARRVAWWIVVDGVPKNEIVAFTFTEAAAEELTFRIRSWLERIALEDENTSLGGMYIGTIHGFCLKSLREFAPDEFYMFDVVDDAGRMALIEQGYNGILGLRGFKSAVESAGVARGKFRSLELFLRGYDLLNEYDLFRVALPTLQPPANVSDEREWCRQAELETNVGESELASAFAKSAARYYAYLRSRRFLDFSTIQSEFSRRLGHDQGFEQEVRLRCKRLVVDEVQDINPVQYTLISRIIGTDGFLTAVGDHRQAIYSFRGSRVDLMGRLFSELEASEDGHIQQLPANYRSTPRLINLSNKWSETILDTSGMTNPSMLHRRETRMDKFGSHVAHLHFNDRNAEAEWIANTIHNLVPTDSSGAFHDENGGARGLKLSDIAILVRSGTDIRTYQDTLRAKGIPAVVRGGPDLFSQPEVLLFLGALAICAGIRVFLGTMENPRSLPGRIHDVLGVGPRPEEVVVSAVEKLRERGLCVPEDTAARLHVLCRAISHRLTSNESQLEDIASLHSGVDCRRWLMRRRQPRRVFPQTIFHWILTEAGFSQWSSDQNFTEVQNTMFHIGQLSSLIKAVETSGWTPADKLQWQLIALFHWGSSAARSSESPMLVSHDAVSITTIHSAKGLEFGTVFLADVCARRFPNNRARTVPMVPFDEDAPDYVNPETLADNENYDDERRLMYVALTRAERYLFISASGDSRSLFFRNLKNLVDEVGGVVADGPFDVSGTIEYHRSSPSRENRIATNFSDLRYFLECPHDFYLRKVLGFAPTIGQEFGYGRGLHNILRVIHLNPKYWARLAENTDHLEARIRSLVNRGLFYLRYTVGEPLVNLQNRAIDGIVDYVKTYAHELARLEFEPEKEFETLIADENLLISGAIDVVRLDDPPRVSIVDFKSGNAEEETGTGLTREMMALQIGVYGLAAKDELEYEPYHGLVRYIGERDSDRRQVEVGLGEEELERVRIEIAQAGQQIRKREFQSGPTDRVENRCSRCDFGGFCPRREAESARTNH